MQEGRKWLLQQLLANVFNARRSQVPLTTLFHYTTVLVLYLLLTQKNIFKWIKDKLKHINITNYPVFYNEK